ncbi:hypothetical protein Ahy_B09g098937 isoform A [Arachis hypogaea]|uniref:Legume lectin domain-containing protein n=3 Tax=Arachis hypogaea TaxID=3818 RepID=A0A444XSI0_ARAHY|nr:hypothetical protein Ahy_B09g098937 isoform A [Arachis hypogaea]
MKPFCVFLTFFLLLAASSKKVDSAETVSFNFNSFSEGNPAINFQGDVTVLSNGNIQLTNLNKVNSVGRVLYAMPVRIWSSATGNVASFLTSFSFEMKDIKDYDPADGIIFFIAPEDTQIPAGSIGGGTLGVSDTKGAGHFVGVEFDTYSNSEYNDPPTDHVGIDVNSVDSVKTVPWNSVSGAVVKVTVIYDSSTKTLSVAVTNDNGDITTIAQVVDLKAKLPERVKFGFSASGSLGGRQIHLIRSWSFTSTLITTTRRSIDNNEKKIMNMAKMLREEREKRRRRGKGGRSRAGAAEFAAAVALPCRQKARTARERTAKREGDRISSPRSQRRRRPYCGSTPSRLATAATTKLAVVAIEAEERESVFAKRGRARAHEGEERRKGKEKQKTMNPGEKEEVCSRTVLLCTQISLRVVMVFPAVTVAIAVYAVCSCHHPPRSSHLLTEYYGSGETKKVSWRESQLKGLRRFLIEKEEDILKALMLDLGKHQVEAFKDEAKLPQIALLSSAEIVPEPLGLVLIISSWNFPFGAILVLWKMHFVSV